VFNQLSQYASSFGNWVYCYTELTVFFLAMAITTASTGNTHFTILQRVEG